MDSKAPVSLAEGEKEVLRHYLTTSDPKKIAELIGKSHHEVERRFSAARKKLGVNRTQDAAVRFALEEGNPAYERAAYGPLVGGESRKFDLIRSSSEAGWWETNWPFPTKGRPWNALPIGMRIGVMLVGLFVLAVTAVLFVSLAQTLTSIARH